MKSLIADKLNQAVPLLNEQDIDLWLTFVRETSLTPDPALDLILGLSMTWHSAFLIARGGEKIAIVGRFDGDSVRGLGAYSSVLTYDQSIRPVLIEALSELDPQSIAVNYSESDSAADGLTHGMWRTLNEMLASTPYAARLVSSERLISSLRGHKSAAEVKRVQAAIASTLDIYKAVGDWLKPGRTEKEIAARMTREREARGLEPAWELAMCPIVNAGPNSSAGHAGPGDEKTARGQLLHMDFGVKQDGFCSDLQRMWYFLDKGEKRAPDDVRRAWDACWGALFAGAEALKTGAQGWQVDEAARAFLVRAGYPEYQHALGHHLGRSAHDGATVLGPRWERYGQTPYGVIEAGNIFTLELGTDVPGRGQIGIEEDVLVTENGLKWLSKPQNKLWLI